MTFFSNLDCDRFVGLSHVVFVTVEVGSSLSPLKQKQKGTHITRQIYLRDRSERRFQFTKGESDQMRRSGKVFCDLTYAIEESLIQPAPRFRLFTVSKRIDFPELTMQTLY